MALWVVQVTLLLLAIFISSCQGKRDKILYCSACKAIVDELEYSISQVDPRRTVQVGSFRLNPDGTMKDKKVPLARSEIHLAELLEGVCHAMSDYALYQDPDTRLLAYRRFAPREGPGGADVFPDIDNFQFNGPDASNDLKFACETLVEELEDDIISLFSSQMPNIQGLLCNTFSDYCRDDSPTKQEL